MFATILVAGLCVGLLVSLWALEVEREKRITAEQNAIDQDIDTLREVERLRGWLQHVQTAALARATKHPLTYAFSLEVEVPSLCTEALDGMPVPTSDSMPVSA